MQNYASQKSKLDGRLCNITRGLLGLSVSNRLRVILLLSMPNVVISGATLHRSSMAGVEIWPESSDVKSFIWETEKFRWNAQQWGYDNCKIGGAIIFNSNDWSLRCWRRWNKSIETIPNLFEDEILGQVFHGTPVTGDCIHMRLAEIPKETCNGEVNA